MKSRPRRLFPAVAECVEEAILDSLCCAETVVGRDGNTRYALPVDEVVARIRKSRPEAFE
jgi:L-aminopeptidase/D-esterase-like protein